MLTHRGLGITKFEACVVRDVQELSCRQKTEVLAAYQF